MPLAMSILSRSLSLINYFNFRPFGQAYLLTNDFGNFAFVDRSTFHQILADDTAIVPSVRAELLAKRFVFDGSVEGFSLKNETMYRDAKNYVFASTGLHIFVMTTACNLECVYCQAHSRPGSATIRMTRDAAKRAADIALECPSPHITIEFQGGEPLANFDAIKYVIEYLEENKGDKEVDFSLVSNLTLLTDEMIDFFAFHHVGISTSIDGFEALHNNNRPFKNGAGSHSTVMDRLARLRARNINVGVIETTTKESLLYPSEIVDSLIDIGVNSISIRPLTPLGCAQVHWESIGYSPEEYVAFYRKALEQIVRRCEEGAVVQEGTATVFFSKALHGYPVNHMEYRSPCGGAYGQLAYYPDGNIFTCDEGRMLYEMGDDSFYLGNSEDSSYIDLVSSATARSVALSSVVESNPGCCDCVYQAYCGVCPVVNYALEHDLRSKTNRGYRCSLSRGIFDTLFTLLLDADERQKSTLESWHV